MRNNYANSFIKRKPLQGVRRSFLKPETDEQRRARMMAEHGFTEDEMREFETENVNETQSQ